MIDILNSGVGVALVTGLLSIIGIAVAEILRRQHKAIGAVKANSDIVLEQTQNSHRTNLRDDLDAVHRDVRQVLDVLRQHGVEIGGLRRDLSHERDERLDVSRRVDHLLLAIPPK